MLTSIENTMFYRLSTARIVNVVAILSEAVYKRAFLSEGVKMARVTVEDCLEHEDNRFALVIMAAQRARLLTKGTSSFVSSKNKVAVTALREIAAKKVFFDRSSHDLIEEWVLENQKRDA